MVSTITFSLILFSLGISFSTAEPHQRIRRADGASLLLLTSTALPEDGLPIPVEYSCKGQDIPMPLQWEGIPSNAQSLALIMDDPDAPGSKAWVHWVVYNMDPTTTELGTSIDSDGEYILPVGSLEGENSWKKTEYGGPCPPGTQRHRYYFKLYALDTDLALDGTDVTKDVLEDAMDGHVVASAELMGTFSKEDALSTGGDD